MSGLGKLMFRMTSFVKSRSPKEFPARNILQRVTDRTKTIGHIADKSTVVSFKRERSLVVTNAEGV